MRVCWVKAAIEIASTISCERWARVRRRGPGAASGSTGSMTLPKSVAGLWIEFQQYFERTAQEVFSSGRRERHEGVVEDARWGSISVLVWKISSGC